MTQTAKVTLLRGDDATRIAEFLEDFKASLGDASLADLNTTRIESESLDLEALRANGMTVPFLAARRLVILEKGRQILSQLSKPNQEKFLEILSQLPETTALVILVDDQLIRRKSAAGWETRGAIAGYWIGWWLIRAKAPL